MKHFSMKLSWVVSLFVLTCTMSCAMSAWTSDELTRFQLTPSDNVDYASDSGRELLSFVELLPELAEQDVTPLVRVYGDGRVVVHRPAYMKRAGTWETWLTTAELDELLRTIAPTLHGFDETLAHDALAADRSARTTASDADLRTAPLHARFDAGISFFELDVNAYDSPRKGYRVQLNQPAIVAWEGLYDDVKRHPEVRVLRELWSVEQLVRDLGNRDDLVLVAEALR